MRVLIVCSYLFCVDFWCLLCAPGVFWFSRSLGFLEFSFSTVVVWVSDLFVVLWF